jgi:hypothetical protein
MSEYVFRYADGYGWKPGAYERENNNDHYGTLHEEIIRCADCEYYHDGKNTDGKRYVEPHCLAIGELAFGAVFEVDERDFCSWAKRKEQ